MGRCKSSLLCCISTLHHYRVAASLRAQANSNQLPWSTHEDEPWPRRKKFKKRKALPLQAESVTLQAAQAEPVVTAAGQNSSGTDAPDDSGHTEETTSTVNVAADTLTTSTPEPTKQHPTPSVPKSPPTPPSAQSSKTASRTTAPAVPVVPALPKNGATDGSKVELNASETSVPTRDNAEEQTEVPEQQKEVVPPPRNSYKNWADILKPAATSKTAASAKTGANGAAANDGTEVSSEQPSTFGVAKSGTISLAEVLRAYRVGGADRNGEKMVFIEPRGLHNSGVDCFMNSVSVSARNNTTSKSLIKIMYPDPPGPPLLHPVLCIPQPSEDEIRVESQE